jgi:hypothetical protein
MNKDSKVEEAIINHELLLTDIGLSGYKIGSSWKSIKQALEDKQLKLDKIDEVARDGGTIVENYDVLCKIRKILGGNDE